MQGKIIKGIAGFYYVHVVHGRIYECKAKGIFRNQNIKPLVGDNVEIDVLDEKESLGNIMKILERKNTLIRPASTNIDQVLVIFAATNPEPNLNLLDRFLISMEQQDIETIICFNKKELVSEERANELKGTYENCGYKVLLTSVKKNLGLNNLSSLICGKTTVFAGPSGVGKSSVINYLMPEAHSKTGNLSEKIQRGKHTTRHSEIFNIGIDTYIMDTPGFSSLSIFDCEKEELKNYYREFIPYEGKCRFNGCVHVNEPDCAVKEALAIDKVSEVRYNNYILLYEELKNRRKY